MCYPMLAIAEIKICMKSSKKSIYFSINWQWRYFWL